MAKARHSRFHMPASDYFFGYIARTLKNAKSSGAVFFTKIFNPTLAASGYQSRILWRREDTNGRCDGGS